MLTDTSSSLLQKYLQKTSKGQQHSAAIAYLAAIDHLQQTSPLVADRIIQELRDQRSYLKLIASENFSSLAVQLAMGNLLTDKYAEGYPYHRFYAGCDNVDAIEAEAISLAEKLFEAEFAYVQPHSGADANLIAFWAVIIQRVQNRELEKLSKKSIDELSAEEYESVRQLLVGQTVMGMGLGSGGHLTHGYRHNISSKMMRAVNYEVDPQTGLLDYDLIAKQAKKEKPLILLAGYSAYPRLINFAKMRAIADSVDATLIVDMAHFAGLVAGKAFTGEYNPIPYAHIATTTTHKTLRGPRGGMILSGKEFADALNRGCPLVMGGPLPNVMAAKAVAFKEADSETFQSYAKQIIANSKAMSEAFLSMGVKLTTGGTDNHLLVLDVTSFGITGRQAEIALREAHLTASRNAIPFDPNGPWYTSGVRLGTPAMTTLGMKEPEMGEIASIITDILSSTTSSGASKAKSHTDEKAQSRAKARVKELLQRFPLYPELVID